MTISNDPDEIRADIERTRGTLSNDVDDLAESVKPKSVARRQVDKVKDAVGSVTDRVMGSDEDDPRSSTVADKADAAKDAVADKADAAKDTVSERASEAREAVREAPTTVKGKAQGNPLAAGASIGRSFGYRRVEGPKRSGRRKRSRISNGMVSGPCRRNRARSSC